MTSNPQIIADLRLVREMNQELELMNTFKGVPFICKASVGTIQDNQVETFTRAAAIVCLKKERQTKVLGSDYFEPSIAQVEAVDLVNGMAVLADFSYLGTRLGERMIVRVEPKSPTQVIIESNDRIIPAEMVDVSISGVGLRVYQAYYQPILKPGTNILTHFDLPNGHIGLGGTILSAVKVGNHYRLSVRFGQDGPQKLTIFHYLSDRRTEIEQELEEEYRQALQIANRLA